MSVKRHAEEDIPNLRYTRIKLESPSPERTSESDTESIHSYQGYKTELVKDTSDSSSPPTSHPYNIEYEVADVEDQHFLYYLSDDSEDKDIIKLKQSISPNDSFDEGLLGDTSEENSTSPTSNSDVDPELPRSDYLDFEKCVFCQTDQKDINYPYCSSCYNWKKSIFPNRPKRCRNRCRTKENESNLNNIKEKDEEKDGQRGVDEVGGLSDENYDDSGVGSSEAQASEDTVDGPSTSNSQNSSQLCRVCFAKLEKGLFVHSTVAHLYGCYSCANKIWYHNKACPICRRKISKVTKLV